MATVATRSLPYAGNVLYGVPWEDYEAMLRIIGDRSIRINYDSEAMEIMSPLQRHGNGAYLLGRMLDTLIDELEIPYEPADPVTLRHPELKKGVEPDKHYHFYDNAAKVCGIWDLDLTIYPPPDLVIEADVTASSIPRLPIYAALGIPEVWRLDGEELFFLHLQPDGTYQPRDHCLAIPIFPLADAARFLEQAQDMDKMAWIRTFRAFVRANYLPGNQV